MVPYVLGNNGPGNLSLSDDTFLGFSLEPRDLKLVFVMDTTIQLFGEIRDKLKTSSEVEGNHFVLQINGMTFEFPTQTMAKNINLGYSQPLEWFSEEHSNHSLHEPGLVTMILVLAGIFKDKKIRFWDVGALYGYFSILALKIFKNAEIYSIEANPYSCDYI